TGLGTSPAWTAEGNQASAELGFSVATAGDVNGDGYSEVIVGAPFYDNGQTDEGRAFLYFGNGGDGTGPGLSLRPQQRRSTDVGPIAHLGASDSPEGFRLSLLARTPFGRGRARLQWEVRPLGSRLNGVFTKTGVTPSDTGVSGASLSEEETGLADVTPYHWRVRLRYEPASVPFAPASRWLTAPWQGLQETMLRTGDPAPAGRVSDGSSGPPLLVTKAADPKITLTWGASCTSTDLDYAV